MAWEEREQKSPFAPTDKRPTVVGSIPVLAIGDEQQENQYVNYPDETEEDKIDGQTDSGFDRWLNKSKLNSSQTVPEMLKTAASIYEERNKLYGTNYKRIGFIMMRLFPEGLKITTSEDFNRLGIFVQLMAKVTRYAAQFQAGGHKDSLDDMAVYAMMLQELDDMKRAEA